MIDVLIPTCDRRSSLAVTLAGLSAQTHPDFRVIISDQGTQSPFNDGEIRTLSRVLESKGHRVQAYRHLPRRGIAEHRQFLLDQSSAPYVLYLDDDIFLDPGVLSDLYRTIREQGCGFVGSAVHGLSYLHDVRPHQQRIEFWQGRVHPEKIGPDSPAWQRHVLHSAANLFHVQNRLSLPPGQTRCYKVAWIGACVLYDAQKLRACGAFEFWKQLPQNHAGEDVLVQLRLMDEYGGCAIIPSGAYHLELETTLPHRDVDAPRVIPVDKAP